MQNRSGFSCFVIGQDTLLIECTEILLAQGHEVKGVLSSAPRIVAWATEKGLATVDPRTDYVEALRREPFDYLFAITHLAIIPDDALALAKKGAINFHDGPLPRYAGLNAPAWALLQRETTYGITWHLMATALDTGSILKQLTFEVAPDETSLSLNTKCFAHAIESFGELVGELYAGTVVKTAQDLSARSYFGRHQRPDAACLLDWTRPASDLAALVRALDFGERYANPLGVAKVVAKGETFLVTRAEERPHSHGSSPGSVISLDEESIGVATGDGALFLLGVSTPGGRPVSARELVGLAGVEVGWRFEIVPSETREALTALDRELGRSEPYWVARLAEFEPWEAPYASTSSAPVRMEQVPLSISNGYQDEAGLVAAFCLYASRMSQRERGAVGLLAGAQLSALGELRAWAADTLPLALAVDPAESFSGLRERVRAELVEMKERGTFLRDVVVRYPDLHGHSAVAEGDAWPVCVALQTEELPRCHLALVLPADAPPRIGYDAAVIDEGAARSIAAQLSVLLGAALAHPDDPVSTVPLLAGEERERVLFAWNRTARDFREGCIHHLIEEQAARTPDRAALIFEDEELTYRELNERANQLAAHLRSLGIGPERLVGIHLERSTELVVAALAVLKAGGAYVPLDPHYPAERIAFMQSDADLAAVITDERHAAQLRAREETKIVRIDAEAGEFAVHPKRNLEGGAAPENLAYVIYTSGSTGTPKGVMVEHRNVVSFFAGMDERIPHDPPGTWLAVTSLSFDISVLELFWTLARGFRIVLHRQREREAQPVKAMGRRHVDFSLFYFASDEGEGSADKYELLIKGAKFADSHGFVAVWTPERHFHAFGGLYPNPAVTGAAVAVLTENVQIRAGSVVLPLHHPVRVAEAWSIVDNLSHGRVGISFASGWQPHDFLLRPESFQDAKGVLFRDLEVVKALWRGEQVAFAGAKGATVSVRTLPRPVQSELPVWITTAGNLETYKMAGRIGANLLTHLLGQSVAELAPKIDAYRAARRENGHDPDAGIVSLMLHAFVGDDPAAVREAVREPLKRYLGSSLELLKQYAWAFPAFTRPTDVSQDKGDDLAHLTAEERDVMLEHAFGRYYETSGLFGRPEDALRRVDEVRAIGVDEIACLIDFGIPTPVVLDHLDHLDRLRGMASSRAEGAAADHSIAAQVRRHRVTHLQCTPSMARMLLEDPAAKAALGNLQCWMIGGEALPVDLARTVRKTTRARLVNMYGPTETTIWSTTHEPSDSLDEAMLQGSIPIGRPIANTRVYVLDARGEPAALGAPGELCIAGDGVARGYLHREELSRERFVPDHFTRTGRMYKTGDLVRYRSDGVLEYIGRRDQQVKIRGHRVELSEIEAVVAESPAIARSVAIVREDTPGDQRLVLYTVARKPIDPHDLRESLRARLPDFMVPAHVVVLLELPYTPNGKIDRKALPPPEAGDRARPAAFAAPSSDMELAIAKLWQEVLGRAEIGADDNFFDVGGHSLLVVRLHRKLRELVASVTLTDLYRFPTIRSLTRYLADSGSSPSAERGVERASIRREMNQRRRARQAEE
jgi:natural product biosynthesis luciferase-like monooxygenase protein